MLTRDRSSADDLAQKTCERALKSAANFVPGTHLDRWCFTIARRLWLNEHRDNKVREGSGLVPASETDIADETPGPEMNIFARQVFDQVQELPEGQRLAVLLVYIEGYSYREAADALEIPIGTVMSRLSTARSKIAERAISTKVAE